MNPTLVIGNFDGVHKGHQALLAEASKHGGPLWVLTFTPHPRAFFRPDEPAFRLTSPATKEEKLRYFGAENVVQWVFDAGLAQLSAQSFLDKVVKDLNPHTIAVGSDFAFGHHRSGTIETLHADGRFNVLSLPLVGEDGAISSSRIRGALAEGQVQKANTLLGWNWFLDGTVVAGDKRGRTLGFPTANIDFGVLMPPKFGVYAVKMFTNGTWLHGVANIGVRPTFGGGEAVKLEVHVFDFERDLYGANVKVEPVVFIRPEKTFQGIEDLKHHIAQDCAAAKAALQR